MPGGVYLGVRTHPLTLTAVLALTAALAAGCGAPSDGPGTTAQPPATSGTSTPGTTTTPPATTEPPTTTTTAPPTSEPSTSAPSTSAPPTTAPPASPAPTTPPTTPPTTTTLGQGDSGPEVLALQQRLTELGYWLGEPDGTYGGLTTQAVLALQGVAGIDRDGRTGAQTRAALDAGTRYQPTSTSGAVTEIDRDKGVIAFVRDGAVTLVLHTSTGTFETYWSNGTQLEADTPAGSYAVSWSYDGWREGDLGRLYRPRYFHPDGIAVHGYTSVPAFPASHGCARVTLPAMDLIWTQDLMPKGSAVVVI